MSTDSVAFFLGTALPRTPMTSWHRMLIAVLPSTPSGCAALPSSTSTAPGSTSTTSTTASTSSSTSVTNTSTSTTNTSVTLTTSSHPDHLDDPYDVAVAAGGTIWVVGRQSNDVFRRTPAGVITQVVDNSGDGLGSTLDALGRVFVTGSESNDAFRITLP